MGENITKGVLIFSSAETRSLWKPTNLPFFFFFNAANTIRWSENWPTHAKHMSLKFSKLLLQTLNPVVTGHIRNKTPTLGLAWSR